MNQSELITTPALQSNAQNKQQNTSVEIQKAAPTVNVASEVKTRWWDESWAKSITYVCHGLTAASLVAGAAIYGYQNLILPARTKLSAHIAQSTPDTLSLYLANEGGRDVVITSLEVRSQALPPEMFIGHVKIKKGGELVEKGKSLLLSSLPSQLNPVVRTNPAIGKGPDIKTTSCSVELDYLDGTGVITHKTLPFECYAFSVIDEEAVEQSVKQLNAQKQRSSGYVGRTRH